MLDSMVLLAENPLVWLMWFFHQAVTLASPEFKITKFAAKGHLKFEYSPAIPLTI